MPIDKFVSPILGRRYVLFDVDKGWVNPATSKGYSDSVMLAGRYDADRSAEYVDCSGFNSLGIPRVLRIPVEDVELYHRKKA